MSAFTKLLTAKVRDYVRLRRALGYV